MTRSTLVSALAALAFVSAASGAAQSGLRGVVTRSPIRPVCMEGVPCSAPAKNTELAFFRTGFRTVTTRTDTAGRYRVALAPGVWGVRAPGSPRIGSGISPSRVRVYVGRFRVVNLDIDTGIR